MKPTSSDASAPETPLQRRVQRRVRATPASEWFTPTPAPRSTPVSRIVGHYLGNDPDARPMSDTTPPRNREASPHPILVSDFEFSHTYQDSDFIFSLK